MKRVIYLVIAIIACSITGVWAQTGVIKGRVYNSISNEAVAYANIIIENTAIGTSSDDKGNYRLENLKPGVYNLICSFIGFKKAYVYEINISTAKPIIVDIPMELETSLLEEAVVKAPAFNKTKETPLSLRTINVAEIYRNPGGNRDISKVIQSLPGVSAIASFRNDLVVRGGSPNENRFFLDGIEVPNINHFATQGSSGGPVGLINVNFIREVDFYAGAFPANRGNMLSSVMDFKLIDGNDERLTGNFMLGSSDIGLTLDGPAGKKSTFIFSVRRSYLQLLFKLLALPFLPTYNDMQFKYKQVVDDKNQFTIIGLGAIDDFVLNTKVNDNLEDRDIINRNNYILGNVPVNTQWNYTVGGKWLHFHKKNYLTYVVSRNHLSNKSEKYLDNIEKPDNKILDYHSQEIENKFRFECLKEKNGWKLNNGVGVEHVLYTNETYSKKYVAGSLRVFDFRSRLTFNKYSVFSQVSRDFSKEKLVLSLGLRTDFSDYSKEMLNPLEQLSPRFSFSYRLYKKLNYNFNVGRYYQLPAYTVMGYRNNDDVLVNKINGLKYIQADHIVSGFEYNLTPYSKITLEGFYKFYRHYPFLLSDSISLANLGGDFGVIGNEAVKSISKGRSYGLELFVQQKLSTSIYGLISYTLVKSAFLDKNETYVSSSWDVRHTLNMTAGKKFKKNWEVGVKFRFYSGAPYTPFDLRLSSVKTVWDVTKQGLYDWDRLNEERTPVSHGMDVRVDKRWYFKKWDLNVYVDIQNIYNAKIQTVPFLNVETDERGVPIEDPGNPMAYKTYLINNSSGTILPSIGMMIQF